MKSCSWWYSALLVVAGSVLWSCSDGSTDGIASPTGPDAGDAGPIALDASQDSPIPDAAGQDAVTDAWIAPDALALDSSTPDTGPGEDASPPLVYPGATWTVRTPAAAGLAQSGLEAFSSLVGGRGVVVRGGTLVFTWGEVSKRADIASASKPFFAHFLFQAVQEGKLAGLDVPVRQYQPGLDSLNPSLGYKDKGILFRHLVTQTSCYGVQEAPGAAFDYNDFQMALFIDTLLLKVYKKSWATADGELFGARLCQTLQCEDSPTFLAFGEDDRPGRVAISVRDHARFALLYLRQGRWGGQVVLPESVASAAVSSPLPNSIPRTTAHEAQMLPGQRTLGSTKIPDDQTDHLGSYSFTWWTNGVDRNGQRQWPDAPIDAYAANGHGGKRVALVIPSLDLVVAWNDSGIATREAMNEALKQLVASVL